MPRPPKRIKINYQNRHNAAALVPFNAKHCLVTDSSRDFAERDRVSSTRLRKDDLPDGNGRASSRIWLEGQPGLGLRGCVGSQGGSPGPFVFLSVYTSVCHLFFFFLFYLCPSILLSLGLCLLASLGLGLMTCLSQDKISHLCFPSISTFSSLPLFPLQLKHGWPSDDPNKSGAGTN